MEVTMVSAVPLFSCGAAVATNAENWGESATTLQPHTSISKRKTGRGRRKNRGENRQQIPETSSATKATFLLPVFFEISPPAIQPKLPDPIIMKDQRGTLMDAAFNWLYREMTRGTKAQKV